MEEKVAAKKLEVDRGGGVAFEGGLLPWPWTGCARMGFYERGVFQLWEGGCGRRSERFGESLSEVLGK